MPRRNRRDRDASAAPARADPHADAPAWASIADSDVRRVASEKAYRCPGCEHVVRPRVWHLVVVPREDPAARRHWHSECWRRELRRLGSH